MAAENNAPILPTIAPGTLPETPAEDITYLKPGAVKIGDVSWTAIPINKDETIVENEIIEVVAVNGNKLIVKKVEEK